MDTVQFVDSISASPTVRLDLNDDVVWGLKYEGTDFSPPDLRRAVTQTMLADGGQVTADVYDNRMLRLRLELRDTTLDAVAGRIQALNRELDRPTNLLKWQPGTTAPVFFRTMRSPVNRVTEVAGTGLLKLVDVDILARPFALGLRETLGGAMNANSTFEAGTTPWTGQNGAVVQSSTFARTGTFSLRFTPTGGASPAGARSEMMPVTAGIPYVATVWMRSVAGYATGCSAALDWYDAAGAFISSSLGTTSALPAGAWTQYQTAALAPAGAAQVQFRARMSGTPLATDVVYVDDATIAQYFTVANDPAAAINGCFFDVTGIKGDVAAPLYLRFEAGTLTNTARQSLIAVRRRGTPSAAPFALQAEASAGGTDTTLGASNDPAFSGSGQNYVRCTFATNASMVQRFSIATWPASPSVDVRGQYRVLARVRKSVAGDTIKMRLSWGDASVGALFDGETTTLRASSTDVHYADLGLLQLPIGHDPVTDGPSGVELAVRGIFLAIYAQRVTGTGNLDIDLSLLLVPADDRLLLVSWQPDSVATAHILDSGRPTAYAVGSSGEVRTIRSPELAGGPPMVSPGAANRVIFMQDMGAKSAGGDVLSNTTTITPYYWPRYLYVRPLAS